MTITFKIVDGDIPFSSSSGRPITIEESNKLRQDIRENLDNEVQFDGTGADLDGMIGLIGDTFSLRAEISSRIIESSSAFRRVQDLVQRFDRTRKERFSRVVQVLVFPLKDPQSGTFSNTTFAYRADFQSVDGANPITITGTIVR